jgi:hypothetical protein
MKEKANPILSNTVESSKTPFYFMRLYASNEWDDSFLNWYSHLALSGRTWAILRTHFPDLLPRILVQAWSADHCVKTSVVDPNPIPKVLAGSESEKNVGFGYGFGSRNCHRMKICVKNRRSNTVKRNFLCFSIDNIFSLTYPVQVPEHLPVWKQLEAPFRKICGQNISLKDPNPKKNVWIRIRKKLVRIHKTGKNYVKMLAWGRSSAFFFFF